jgi:N-acyl-D-amino-acid deacylase
MEKTGEFDLVVRGGTIVDGSGAPSRRGDVGVVGDRIVAVGEVDGTGKTEIDADGLVVAPGFVDAHTHMDAQAFWDDLGMPACWHGVTSVVMGNCGFTLAPARRGAEALVVRNLERAEDIAGEAMAAGITWSWETFSEFLDTIERLPKGLNHAASIGHSALRTFAMGERAFEGPATEDDLEVMAVELRAALRAGAAGFTTSRSRAHATSDDRPVASRLATWAEVQALVGIVGHESDAIFQLAPERGLGPEEHEEFLQRLGDLAVESTAPIVFGHFATKRLAQPTLELIDETVARGGDMWALTHSRGVVSAQSFQTRLGFDKLAEWQEVRSQPIEAQKSLLRDPEVRARLVHAAHHGDYGESFGPEAGRPKFDSMRILLSVYPPHPTVAEEATRRGVDPVEAMIDVALEHDLNVFFMQDLVPQNDDDLVATLRHPRAAMCFSDNGAHVSQIFDASIYSHLLGYWVRERQAFSIEEAVEMITSRPAAAWRLRDRGHLAPGFAADITIFDPATVGPQMPYVVHDVPGDQRRIEQRATGFAATIVNGQVLTRDGVATEARPGRLLRAGAGRS